MKNRLTWLFSITSITWSLLSSKVSTIGSDIQKGKSNYILIRSLTSDSSATNAALLIEDRSEISYDKKLFHGNNRYGHGCDYEYAIQFWENPKKTIFDIPYSSACERFVNHNNIIKSLMLNYIKQLRTTPSHYIYNLQVDITKTPEALFQEFETDGLKPFFLNNTLAHLSSLTFSYNQSTSIKNIVNDTQLEAFKEQNKNEAVYNIDLIVNEIDELTKVEKQSGVTFPMHSFSGETITDEALITLKLANGVNHMQIRELIKNNGGKVIDLISPENYSVQLVHKSNHLSEIKTITNKFRYVKEVSKYTSSK